MDAAIGSNSGSLCMLSQSVVDVHMLVRHRRNAPAPRSLNQGLRLTLGRMKVAIWSDHPAVMPRRLIHSTYPDQFRLAGYFDGIRRTRGGRPGSIAVQSSPICPKGYSGTTDAAIPVRGYRQRLTTPPTSRSRPKSTHEVGQSTTRSAALLRHFRASGFRGSIKLRERLFVTRR